MDSYFAGFTLRTTNRGLVFQWLILMLKFALKCVENDWKPTLKYIILYSLKIIVMSLVWADYDMFSDL